MKRTNGTCSHVQDGKPLTNPMPLKIGVMGGATGRFQRHHMDKAHRLGNAIAKNGIVLITGACPGLPLAAACGAKQAGGMVVGISPALSLDEHVSKYRSPADFHDVLIFTGSGLMGREVVNIRSSDIVIIIGGRSGTLGELAIAYDEGKLIGVLTGTGGISDMVSDILAKCSKRTGSKVIYDEDPESLVRKLIRTYHTKHAPRPSCYCTDQAPGEIGGDEPELMFDPVCGMKIRATAAIARRIAGKRRFVFCSKACVDRFDAAPEQYSRASLPGV
jgi:uncharacterized protein (TIGR00725 family)